MSRKTAICTVAHDDCHFEDASIRSFHCGLPLFYFVSEKSWVGDSGDYGEVVRIARSLGATVITGQWESEEAHRNAAYSWLRENGFEYAITADGDEIIEPSLLDAMLRIAEQGLADRVFVEWDTYWRSAEYVIRPRERFTPMMMFNLNGAKYERVREFSGGRPLLLNEAYGIVHHMSYAGPDCRILRKITSWGHRNEVRPDWYEKVWLRWPQDKAMRNLHPTSPECYGFAERIHVPGILRSLADSAQETKLIVADKDVNNTRKIRNLRTKRKSPNVRSIEAGDSSPRGEKGSRSLAWPTTPREQEPGLNFPSVSVVIPLFGGEDDIARCLRSLDLLPDLVLETIVVDNGSPDNAADVAQGFAGASIVRLGENKGFAAACNEGIKRAKGEVVLLLNSDTAMTRSGLVELLRSLTASGAVAAAGPHSNNSSQGQQVPITYTSLDHLELFAEDFAERDEDDVEVDMLVGFCIAIRKSALAEIGPLDENFGFGMFEDNDLCYRLRRAGYRLALSGKSFVHHEGSKTLRRMGMDAAALFDRNRRYFLEKWKADLDSGFVNTLSGFGEAIQFRPKKSPERRLKEIARLARRADISLCMIVRDEERVLRECLESIKPFVREMIVVDTGSTDRTKEIALELGAKVYDFPWTNSFSDARNESLRHAKGKWIFWMDADDVIDFASGETLLNNALAAPPNIVGFVVPVRFVDDGPAGGVQVDHVKLFRNLPCARFEFHIHEQILHSLKGPGREIARSSAFVLHKGYDTSAEGQKKKRERDRVLLRLDLEENPNHQFVNFNTGMTSHYTDAHEEAIGYLEKSIALAEPTESHVRKAYSLLAVSLDKVGRTEEAYEKLREGLEALPDDPEIHFHLAQILTRWQRFAEARDHYSAVLAAQIGDHFSSVDRGILGFKTLHNRADIDMAMGDYPEAKKGWLAAIEAAPQFTPSVFSLFDAALETADLPTARAMLDRICAAEGHNDSWCKMAARYGERIGGPAATEQLLLSAANSHPEAWGPRLALARILLNTGRGQEAVPLLRDLQAAGIAEGAFHLGLLAEQAGDYASALAWMRRADGLNPNHADTSKHLEMLRECLEGGKS